MHEGGRDGGDLERPPNVHTMMAEPTARTILSGDDRGQPVSYNRRNRWGERIQADPPSCQPPFSAPEPLTGAEERHAFRSAPPKLMMESPRIVSNDHHYHPPSMSQHHGETYHDNGHTVGVSRGEYSRLADLLSKDC